jgi:hypothetical protein
VQDLAPEKASGPDGFIGTVFTLSWPLIKEDLYAVHFFYQQHNQHLSHLNMAHIVLVPKKSDAQCVG